MDNKLGLEPEVPFLSFFFNFGIRILTFNEGDPATERYSLYGAYHEPSCKRGSNRLSVNEVLTDSG